MALVGVWRFNTGQQWQSLAFPGSERHPVLDEYRHSSAGTPHLTTVATPAVTKPRRVKRPHPPAARRTTKGFRQFDPQLRCLREAGL